MANEKNEIKAGHLYPKIKTENFYTTRLMSLSSSEIIWLLPEAESYWRRHFKVPASREKGSTRKQGKLNRSSAIGLFFYVVTKCLSSQDTEPLHKLVTFPFPLVFLWDNTLYLQITLNHSTSIVITFKCYKM